MQTRRIAALQLAHMQQLERKGISMMWGYHGFGGGWGWGMGIGMLLFWAVIVFLIVMVARGFGSRSSGGYGGGFPRERTAIDILRERYAKGEIEKAEFEQKLRDLERTGSASQR